MITGRAYLCSDSFDGLPFLKWAEDSVMVGAQNKSTNDEGKKAGWSWNFSRKVLIGWFENP